jgi:hypothetical protein
MSAWSMRDLAGWASGNGGGGTLLREARRTLSCGTLGAGEEQARGWVSQGSVWSRARGAQSALCREHPEGRAWSRARAARVCGREYVVESASGGLVLGDDEARVCGREHARRPRRG